MSTARNLSEALSLHTRQQTDLKKFFDLQAEPQEIEFPCQFPQLLLPEAA